jgi:transposase InsO family protein
MPLGRPVTRSARQQRNAVLAVLAEVGPALGLPTLRQSFPDMHRAELEDLLRRYRRFWRRRYTHQLYALRWQQPGTVWAVDHAEPPQPIDGTYAYLLAVRDLASGRQLLWLPQTQSTSQQTIAALSSLFALHGAPLVLKMDNGSAFCAEDLVDFLHRALVIPLFSPPRTPRYNGAIEAGIGSLKTRTEVHATHHGHPAHWTWEDTAAAQDQANATARPHGATGPTPDQAWQQRTLISQEQRCRFLETVQQRRHEARTEQGWPMEGALPQRARRVIDRAAIRRALVEHGYLYFRRRSIPLPFTKRIVASYP